MGFCCNLLTNKLYIIFNNRYTKNYEIMLKAFFSFFLNKVDTRNNHYKLFISIKEYYYYHFHLVSIGKMFIVTKYLLFENCRLNLCVSVMLFYYYYKPSNTISLTQNRQF